MTSGGYYRPTDTEIAINWLPGLLPMRPMPAGPRSAGGAAISPIRVLDDVLRPALLRSPCVVSFSGGRDSSAVLAAAVDLARREGLAEPVAFTQVYPETPETDEAEWQRAVIEHVRLKEWIRVELREEHDLLGPVAQEGLTRRGLVWPTAVQLKATIFSHAAGGSVLTGEGGDEVLGPRRNLPLLRVIRGPGLPSVGTVRALVTALAPGPAQRLVQRRRRTRMSLPWVHESVRRAQLTLIAQDMATEPLHWGRGAWWLTRRRANTVAQQTYVAMGREYDVEASEPLLDERFIAAVAEFGGALGFATRTEVMSRIFGGLLPDAVLRRTSKATFTRAYLGAATRRFAESWNGQGVNEDIVDVAALRAEWLSPWPSALSSALLHAAWLAVNGVPTSRAGSVA
jgi:hypothetical protein